MFSMFTAAMVYATVCRRLVGPGSVVLIALLPYGRRRN